MQKMFNITQFELKQHRSFAFIYLEMDSLGFN